MARRRRARRRPRADRGAPAARARRRRARDRVRADRRTPPPRSAPPPPATTCRSRSSGRARRGGGRDRAARRPALRRPTTRACARSSATARSSARAPVTTFDAWAQRAGLDRLDVVKIDIEGAEILALRGMRATLRAPAPARCSRSRSRTSSWSAGPGDEAALHALLAECGYVPAGSPERHVAVFRPPGSRRQCGQGPSRSPAAIRPLRTRFPANHGELRELAQPDAARDRSRGRTSPASRRGRGSATTARRHDGRQQRERHADRRERVVHEHPPAVGHARAPAHEVGAGRAGSGARRRRTGGRPARRTRAAPAPRSRARGARAPRRRRARGCDRNAARSRLAERRLRRDLPRPAVRADVRVDAHDLDVRPRAAREHDRRPPAERADLDDPPAGRHRRRRGEQPPRLRLGQPALDAARRPPRPPRSSCGLGGPRAPRAQAEREHREGDHALHREDDPGEAGDAQVRRRQQHRLGAPRSPRAPTGSASRRARPCTAPSGTRRRAASSPRRGRSARRRRASGPARTRAAAAGRARRRRSAARAPRSRRGSRARAAAPAAGRARRRRAASPRAAGAGRSRSRPTRPTSRRPRPPRRSPAASAASRCLATITSMFCSAASRNSPRIGTQPSPSRPRSERTGAPVSDDRPDPPVQHHLEPDRDEHERERRAEHRAGHAEPDREQEQRADEPARRPRATIDVPTGAYARSPCSAPRCSEISIHSTPVGRIAAAPHGASSTPIAAAICVAEQHREPPTPRASAEQQPVRPGAQRRAHRLGVAEAVERRLARRGDLHRLAGDEQDQEGRDERGERPVAGRAEQAREDHGEHQLERVVDAASRRRAPPPCPIPSAAGRRATAAARPAIVRVITSRVPDAVLSHVKPRARDSAASPIAAQPLGRLDERRHRSRRARPACRRARRSGRRRSPPRGRRRAAPRSASRTRRPP